MSGKFSDFIWLFELIMKKGNRNPAWDDWLAKKILQLLEAISPNNQADASAMLSLLIGLMIQMM